MRRVVLRPDAEADIEAVADYTIAEWGHEQARKYVEELRRATERLAADALRYPVFDQIVPGLRRKRSGMHHIYYLTTEDSVEVLNVVHVQRDPGLHLKIERWSDPD